MQDEKGMRECEFCGQMLGHCAYYRYCHDINGLVCPGRVQLNDSDHSNFSDLDFDGVSDVPRKVQILPSILVLNQKILVKI